MNRITTRARSLRRNLLACAIALGAGTASAATPPVNDYAALARDVRLLGKVLEESTATEAANGRRGHRGAHIEGLYLAGQGMVFEVRLGGGSFFRAFAVPAVPPVPPIPPLPASGGEALIDDGQMEMIFDKAMSDAEMDLDEFDFDDGADKQEREQLRALREAVHKAASAYAQQQRAYGEALRDDKAAASRDKLRAEAERSRQQFESARKQLQERSASLREQQRQLWQAGVQKTEAALLDTLCSYAASTRRLGAGEHVSLVVEGAMAEGDDQRRIWVVRKADLDACASGSQAGDYLRKKAQSYLM